MAIKENTEMDLEWRRTMKKKKTMHELCKEYPNKTYAELEKYRNADRFEEAIGIGHNNPPEDDEEKHEV